jgi:predicted ATP-dependent protease
VAEAPPPSALPPDDLRPRLPEGALPFEDTDSVEPSDHIVGQARALAAIRQAVEMHRPGYNLFITGLDTGGRLQTVHRVLRQLAPKRRQTRDFVYLHRHDDPFRPQLLSLPAGAGPRLRRAVHELREALFDEIPRVLDSDAVGARRDRIVRDLEREQRDILLELQEEVRTEGFELGGDEEDEDGLPLVVLVTDDGPVTRAEAHLMAHEGRLERSVEELETLFDRFEDRLAQTLSGARRATRIAHGEVVNVEQEAIREQTAHMFDDVGRKFRAARRWVRSLHEAVVERLDIFRADVSRGDGAQDADAMPLISAFSVNVVHRGSRSRKAPILVVPDPTFGNLFGGIVTDGPGVRFANHTHLRAGALHDADGGFLVINAADLVSEAGAWKTLKRAMTFGQLGLHNVDVATHGAPPPLRPDPAPLDVKVVLLGDEGVYSLLSEADPDFKSIFKIKAEFEDSAELTADLADRLAAVLTRLQRREGNRPLHREAVAELILHSVRQSDLPGRVLLSVGALADVMREADYLATGPSIRAKDVRAALDAREARHDSVQRRMTNAMQRDALHVATQGDVTGQLNGLAVIEMGGARFGRPLRITATAGAARFGEVLNVERESMLSGPAHDKGILVLTGFLQGQFGQERTLSLRASICIEQHHSGIDGDSASAAELVALLSAISGLPIRQDRAMTGSIDQLGAIRPVGGVNEKIEGFHALCRSRGLTGDQGVLIPAANVADLCLKGDVVADCAAGIFHVWPVATLPEALSLLFEVPIGDPAQRQWPPETLYGKVMAALAQFERVVQTARQPVLTAASAPSTSETP